MSVTQLNYCFVKEKLSLELLCWDYESSTESEDSKDGIKWSDEMSKDVAEEYASSLADLTVNSKPLINMLTMLADDYITHAPCIVKAVEAHLQKVRGDIKLPVLYLIDSIVKNVGKDYISLFTQNIVSTFCSVFEKVDEKVRAQMFKLRQTWNEVFPTKKLYALDARVNAIDPAWPITASPPTSIHVNPKFLQGASPSPPVPSPDAVPSNINDGVMREQLLKKQKELLELQKRKVELELLQTKAILEEQQKKLENHTASFKSEPVGLKSSQGVPKADGHFLNQAEPMFINSHTSSQVDVAQRLVPGFHQDSQGRSVKCNSTSLPISETLHQPTSSSQQVPSTISASIRSRDPRIRLKEKMNEKKGKTEIPDTSEKLATGKINTLGVINEMCSKTKKKKKSLVKKKDKGNNQPQTQLITYPDSDKETQTGLSNAIERKGESKRENKNERAHKLNCDKVKTSRKTVPNECEPHTQDKNIGFKSNDKCKKHKVEETDKELCSDISEKCSTGDEINIDPDNNIVRKTPKSAGCSDTKDSNLTSVKIDKRKLVHVDSIHKRACLVETSKTISNNLIVKNKSPRGKYQKYLKESGEDNSSTPAPSTPAPSTPAPSTPAPSTPAPSTPAPSTTAAIVPSNEDMCVSLQQSQHGENILKVSTSATQRSKKKKAGKDIDLRLLPSTTKRRLTETGIAPIKKSKAEIMDTLFGNEDVDLRTLPPQPPTPPPPIISDSSITPDQEKSWANYKQIKNDSKSPEEKRRRSNIDRLGRPLLYIQSKGEGSDDDKTSRPSDNDRSNANCNLIITQAEEQLNSGNITFSQYNRMLKEVITMNEERKLQEAQRKDELEGSSNTLINDPEVTEDISTPPTELAEDKECIEITNRIEDNVATPQGKEIEEPFSRNFIETNVEMKSRHFKQETPRKPDCERKNYPIPFEHPMPTNWLIEPPVPLNVQPPVLARDVGPYPPRWNPSIPRPLFDRDNNQYTGFSDVHPGPIKNHFPTLSRDLPPADPLVLEMIKNDTMHTINIDGVPREVRFYGEVAIIMLFWDDPREITFQPGSRRILIDEREPYILNFNSPYREILLDGIRTKIRLGAPTRELFIDGQFYQAAFGGPPIQIMVAGRLHSFKLEGPLPQVRIGNIKRTDLVAGKINLIVDAKPRFPLFLDAKPQWFEIDGIPYILRFVEALQTVVINGRPFKIEFGGLPVPIYFHGVKHFLRLSVLPEGIKAGYVSIINMEGGRLPSPPPLPPRTEISPNLALSIDGSGSASRDSTNAANPNVPLPTHGSLPSQHNQGKSGNEHPLELLTSLMPTAMAPSSGQSYTVEQASEEPAPTSTHDDINVGELFRKLVAIGIVPPVKEKEQPVKNLNTVRPVDFSQADTLKVRQPNLIKRLYSGIQCSSCGVRFSPEHTLKYSQHLDWHFRQNRRDRDSARIAQSRRWYYDISDWIQYQEIEDLEERAQSWFEIQEGKVPTENEEIKEEEPSVVAGPDNENVSCDICEDKFEQFYNEEKEEWHLRRAMRVNNHVYHPLCYQDFKESQVKKVPEPGGSDKCENNSTNCVEIGIEMETIELDDTTLEEERTCSNLLAESDYNLSLSESENKDSSEIEIISDPGEESHKLVKSPSLESCILISEVTSEEISSSINGSKTANESEDDDILQVEVLERKIESYEIPDDDDDDSNLIFNTEETNVPEDSDNDFTDIDFSKIKIKKEKQDIDLPDPVVDTTHISLTTSIDGNVELEEAPQMVIPGKIKINISKGLLGISKKVIKCTSSPSKDTTLSPPISSDQPCALTIVQQMQPLPPGEELYPAQIKPRLVGIKLTERPIVSKGNELSGLCSIM